jgi:hypothetical protein
MDCTAYPQLLGQRAFGRKPVSIPEFTVNDHRLNLLYNNFIHLFTFYGAKHVFSFSVHN